MRAIAHTFGSPVIMANGPDGVEVDEKATTTTGEAAPDPAPARRADPGTRETTQPRQPQPQPQPQPDEPELEDWWTMKTNELNEVPTYYPTMEEFADFEGYMSRPDVWASGMAHGIVKVQPPKEWMDQQHDFEKEGIPQHILETTIPTPAQQLANGHKGIYECVPVRLRTAVCRWPTQSRRRVSDQLH